MKLQQNFSPRHSKFRSATLFRARTILVVPVKTKEAIEFRQTSNHYQENTLQNKELQKLSCVFLKTSCFVTINPNKCQRKAVTSEPNHAFIYTSTELHLDSIILCKAESLVHIKAHYFVGCVI